MSSVSSEVSEVKSPIFSSILISTENPGVSLSTRNAVTPLGCPSGSANTMSLLATDPLEIRYLDPVT